MSTITVSQWMSLDGVIQGPSSPEARDLAEPLGSKPKYVASRTLTGPLEWQNSTLLKGGPDRGRHRAQARRRR
ncbi:hypothetical protein [Nonomuraea sediminis]|uniref:hypothetical protein n=1 Tax=Nonomuraea sediminis TaxID=2835864 RepID=UPI001BDD1150|nr:hypothetical protein [Nonomuraea sediminis]